MFNEKKYVLQVCAYAAPYPGNFIESLKRIDNEIRNKGYDTIFAFPESAKELQWCKELEKEYKIYYLPLTKARINIRTYITLKQIYKENNIIIAHSHFELYDIAVNIMAPKNNVKVFWHLHDSLDLIYKNSNLAYKLLWRFQYSIFSKNVKLLSVSEKARDFAIKLGFDSNNAFFLPNGIDTKRIEKKERNEKKYDFLLFGWDFKRKGVDLLLESIKYLEKEDFNVALVASKDTWNLINTDNYKQLIRQEPVNEVSTLYHSTRCFLHISRSEGLSYALLEAIYSGCLVICSDIEQNQFAKQFPTVIFVENENTEMIAFEMKNILHNCNTINEKKINLSKQIIKDEYSLHAWLKKILKLYYDEKN